jgi:RHH-type proline utilization regulon transcriptional repressor/proline dehydrogenase/delta 1-pyrroline-5-carboxylate dehydrogenase
MNGCSRDEAFKVEAFRFVDVFPILKSFKSISRHLQEYFLRPDQGFPKVVTWGVRGGAVIPQILAKPIAKNISSLARRFIAGTTAQDALEKLQEMHRFGIA